VVLRALRAISDAASPAESPSPDFAAARRRWKRAGDERRALKVKYEGASAALMLALNPPGKDDHPSPRLIELANAYLGGRRSASVPALQAELVELDDQLRRAATAYAVEKLAWEQAVAAEACRLTEELRPAHKQACRRIAKTVEELSAAVEEERAVRSRLAELGASDALVDAGREFGTLPEFHSRLSEWNRRLLASGALDP
jgi:hypothetical protein